MSNSSRALAGATLAGALVGGALAAKYLSAAASKPAGAVDHARAESQPGFAGELIEVSSVAMVTGVAPGTMGEGIAEALAKMGCKVACVEHPARIKEAQKTAARLATEHGVQTVALAADATSIEQVEQSFVDSAKELGAEVNIVVSTVGGGGVDPKSGELRNGGTHPNGTPRTEHSWEESWEVTMLLLLLLLLLVLLLVLMLLVLTLLMLTLSLSLSHQTTMRILRVTQFSQHHCCKAAARHMIAGGRGGSILLIGSIMADFNAPTSASYSSSKCAVKKLGMIMARELAPHGVRVNILQPGHSMRAALRCLALPLLLALLLALLLGLLTLCCLSCSRDSGGGGLWLRTRLGAACKARAAHPAWEDGYAGRHRADGGVPLQVKNIHCTRIPDLDSLSNPWC